MKKNEKKSLQEILQELEELEFNPIFVGYKILDKNFAGNFLLIESSEKIYSFNLNDIVKEESLPNGKTKISIRLGCTGSIIKAFKVSNEKLSILSISDNSAPPKPEYKKDDPKFGNINDIENIKKLLPRARTLASVAANWSDPPSCELGDSESPTNCAHYLSNAFIKAGYNELKKSSGNPNFNEWCDYNDTRKSPNARPIRAKEMWEWFKSVASLSQRTKPSQKGFWAVFQWDAAYSGGHVLLYDSDNDKAYGTGAYWNWSHQYFYQF